jgi:hypothetical protein
MKSAQIGRLAMRAEGTLWNAYYALKETMDDAIFLGSIRLAAVRDNPERKQVFMDLMRATVSDILEAETGHRPSWSGPETAPEHERGGNG